MNNKPKIKAYHLDREGIRIILRDLEADIMEYFWELPMKQGAMSKDVFESMFLKQRVPYPTVMSTLARLSKLNLLRVDRHSKSAYVYCSTLSRDELIAWIVEQMTTKLEKEFPEVWLKTIQPQK